ETLPGPGDDRGAAGDRAPPLVVAKGDRHVVPPALRVTLRAPDVVDTATAREDGAVPARPVAPVDLGADASAPARARGVAEPGDSRGGGPKGGPPSRARAGAGAASVPATISARPSPFRSPAATLNPPVYPAPNGVSVETGRPSHVKTRISPARPWPAPTRTS